MPSTREVVFIIVTGINLFNFIDRGIIPGSTNEFNTFIRNSINTQTPDVYLGLLQSSFVIGFLIGALVFGHLVHHYERFFLTRVGSWIWFIAVFFSGISYYTESYAFLLICRMVSGLGEASLQCTIPPWIQENADAKKKGLWLAIFYTATPVGVALGYAYSSLITSNLNWSWAFIGECFLVFPWIFYLFRFSDNRYTTSTLERKPETFSPLAQINDDCDDNSNNNNNINNDDIDGLVISSSVNHEKPSIWKEVITIIQQPLYLCFIFAATAQTAVLIGLSTFGSAFAMGLGYFDLESEASSMFGLLISIAGIIATPLGGWIIDFIDHNSALHPTQSNAKSPQSHKSLLTIISCISYWFTLFGTLIFCCLYYAVDRVSFFFLITIACAFVFCTTTGVNLAIMITVPTEHQSFAIAFGSLIGHILGDVPSPVITGWLKDVLAPGCTGSDEDSDNAAGSASCRADSDGLRMCIFLVSVWLYWAVMLFGVAWHLLESSKSNPLTG